MKNEMLYTPITCTDENYIEKFMEVIEENERRIDDIEKKAIENGGLLYRFIYEGVADGKAIYQIVKENKNTVQIQLCSLDGLHYDYMVPYWGHKATIDKTYAQQQINAQDAWRKIITERSYAK